VKLTAHQRLIGTRGLLTPETYWHQRLTGTGGLLHDFLIAPVQQCPRPEPAVEYRKRLPENHQINFAHADLSYEHILVDQETGNVTGILD
jgi:hypothetical protein